MSNLFCFGCNYPGEEHDERCPEFVDVPRLVAQRDRLRDEVEHWKNRAETMNVDAGRRHVENLALRDLVRDLFEALEDGRECSDDRRRKLIERTRMVLDAPRTPPTEARGG